MPPNPFQHIRTRSLLLWFLIGLPTIVLVSTLVPEIAGLHMKGGLGTSLVVIALYLLALVWTLRQADRHGVAMRRLLHIPDHVNPLQLLALALVMILFSFGAIWVLFLPISYLAPAVVERVVVRAGSDALIGLNEPWFALLLNGITIVVLAPLVEELIFRGFLLNRWATKWGLRRAVFLTSAMFALLHVNVLAMFALGSVLAVLYLRTRTLAASIFVHAANNLAVLLMAFLGAMSGGGGTGQPRSLAAFRAQAPIPLLCFALALPVIITLLWRGWPLLQGPPPYAADLALAVGGAHGGSQDR